MSRSGYSDGDSMDNWDLIRWRGAVASATRGKRGQRLFKDMLVALDAMPVKELIAEELTDEGGGVCALGALGKARALAHLDILDPEEHDLMGVAFDVAPCLIQEIEWENDECWTSPARRWEWMRRWVARQIKEKAA